MSADLTAFLKDHRPFAQSRTTWPAGIELAETCYVLDSDLPPAHYVTSVRAVVLKEDRVLVCRDPEGTHHLLPGGRCQEGETLVETLRREVLEETGWTIAAPALIGLVHFCHLTPKPPDYPYPYPDFLQLVYAACALTRDQSAMARDEYVKDSFLVPVDELDQYDIIPHQRRFLEVALKAIASPRSSP
jgi:ADP-ribose pyrophosphatase YjhB (NUDIX family)